MADKIAHASLSGADLHEPKGVETADDGAVLSAENGIGVWKKDLSLNSLILETNVFKSFYIQTVLFSPPGSDSEINSFFLNPIDKSGSLTIKVYWIPTATASGNIVFRLNGEDTIINNTNVSGLQNSTLVNTSLVDGIFSISRIGSSLSDNFPVGINIHAIEVIYETNRIGAVNV